MPLCHAGCIQLSPILGLLILFWCVFSWDWCVSLVVFRSKLYLMWFVVLKCKIYLRIFFVVFRGYWVEIIIRLWSTGDGTAIAYRTQCLDKVSRNWLLLAARLSSISSGNTKYFKIPDIFGYLFWTTGRKTLENLGINLKYLVLWNCQ